VNYEGRLTDGTVFDSSAQHGGQPATLGVGNIIPCWTEALQLMKVGGKSRIVCPSGLAYGDRGAPPKIKPGATLEFDIELVSIEPPVAPPGAPRAHCRRSLELREARRRHQPRQHQNPSNPVTLIGRRRGWAVAGIGPIQLTEPGVGDDAPVPGAYCSSQSPAPPCSRSPPARRRTVKAAPICLASTGSGRFR
jgi:hypothetical protein